jgi:hypothetical protein
MPLVWRGVLDLFGQIWHKLGFLFVVRLLQWLELLVRKRNTVSFNKVGGVPIGDGLRRGSCNSSLPLSCRGGKGRREREASFFLGRYGGGGSSVTCASKLEASLALLSMAGAAANVRQPPSRRLYLVLAAGARHLVTTKWFVPGGF